MLSNNTQTQSLSMSDHNKPNKMSRFFLRKKDDSAISTTDGSSSSCGQRVNVSLSDSLSVYSQSTASTEACSVVSNDSSLLSVISEQVTSARRSALKRENAPRRLDQGVRLRFSSAVEQRRLLARHEYTTEELDACWFRGDEYAQITRSCCKQIEKLEQGAQLKDQKYCARGLESHTRLAALAKAQNRRAAWDAVLDEQDEQISLGVVDDEPISRRYHDASWSCQLWAMRVAQDDQRVAELVYDSMLD